MTTANCFGNHIFNVGSPTETARNDFSGVVMVMIETDSTAKEFNAGSGGRLLALQRRDGGPIDETQQQVGTWSNARSARGAHFSETPY